MAEFDDIPLVDGHLHPPLLDPDAHPFVRYFTEAGDDEILEYHSANTLFFRRAISELAAVLGCEPFVEAVQVARRQLGADRLTALLVDSGNIETLLVDDGYPRQGALTIEQIASASQRSSRRVLRLEALEEDLVPRASSPQHLGQLLLEQLEARKDFVGLKSIVAYRSGLDVVEPDSPQLQRGFDEARSQREAGDIRLQAKAVIDFCLLRALEWAADAGTPVQFHTGFGDRDIDLALANPTLLRRVLETPRLKSLRIVLLHASYPYVREAAYLASVYPQVYIDWSEANPMLSHAELRRALEQLLALAPYTKLLYGSDAWGIPDWIFLGARWGRAALAAALSDQPADLCRDIAWRVLHDNACELYGL